jgi:exonuclease VII small subunit
MEKFAIVEEEEIGEVFPVDLNTIRQKIGLLYGDKAIVSHLNSVGDPLDEILPSQFVQDYIIINHELIEVGEFANPIPKVFLMKYTQENYIAIDSKEEDLRPTLFEDFLRTRIEQLRDAMRFKDSQIAENMGKIESLGEVISKLQGIIPDETIGKSQAEISLELGSKETHMRELRNIVNSLKDEKYKLQEELGQLRESPIEDLVNELQLKINKQRLVITKLKHDKIDSPGSNGDSEEGRWI